jgi:hypothetical protein
MISITKITVSHSRGAAQHCQLSPQKSISKDEELKDNDEVQRAINRFWIKAGAIASIPVIIVGVVIWLATGVGQMAQFVTGSPNAVSKSMELTDLKFRTYFGPERANRTEGSVYEWRLRLPRAYIVNEIGMDDDISGPGSGAENETHTAYLAAELDPKTGQLAPEVLAPKYSAGTYLGIDMENTRAPSILVRENECLRDVDFGPLVGSNGGFKCLKSDVRCRVYTHYHKWALLLIVPKDTTLYTEPARACSLAAKFLDQYTLSVE